MLRRIDACPKWSVRHTLSEGLWQLPRGICRLRELEVDSPVKASTAQLRVQSTRGLFLGRLPSLEIGTNMQGVVVLGRHGTRFGDTLGLVPERELLVGKR